MNLAPLSGYEVTVLALLAQARRLSLQDKGRILSKLDGSALKIAQILTGQTIQASESEFAAAKGFQTWAHRVEDRHKGQGP